ncbi:hypothetical protein BN1221_03878 [Brenneria goodwinii]|uniref:Uncharacterized protein n=1 Tax=Brenneria goodwinii TaxID=1109412 RepID=A0A0G4JZU0_9GAMM|nr:hypothetical protein BN1221_03878 [Brenneria goodwinii]
MRFVLQLELFRVSILLFFDNVNFLWNTSIIIYCLKFK